MPTFELLGTDHCTLCDAAMDWLLAAPLLRGLSLTTVDITTSEDLFARYGDRVPVLLLRQGDEVLGELLWPFEETGS